MSHVKANLGMGLTVAMLALGGVVACSHDEVDRGVDRATNGAHKAAAKVNESLHSANDEIKDLGKNLPPAHEVKEDIKEVGRDVRDGAETAGRKIRAETNELRRKAND